MTWLQGIVVTLWLLSPIPNTVTNYSCQEAQGNRMAGCHTMYNGQPVNPKAMSCDRERLGQVWAIDAVGVRYCGDIGGSVSGNHFDIYNPSYAEAVTFGIQQREARRLK